MYNTIQLSACRLELGGALGTVKDKIFVASGSEVKGFTKKGKMFLQFETNLAERIRSMHICGSHLLVCGNYVFNHYNDCRCRRGSCGGCCWLERDRMAQGEPNQMSSVGFFLFGPFPEENMFGFS